METPACINTELKLMAYKMLIEAELAHFTKRYYIRLQEKNFDMADCIDRILTMYNKELEIVTRDIENCSRQVPETQPTGNKKVFILER